MNPEGIVTLIFVCGLVWGGLAYFIFRVVKGEKGKKNE